MLCTRNPEKLAKVAGEYRIAQTCCDYRELVDMNVDGVMIHTSSETHATIATYFLERGIPVFVDKPATLNFADYQKLHDLSEQHSVPCLWVSTAGISPFGETLLSVMICSHFPGTSTVSIFPEIRRIMCLTT